MMLVVSEKALSTEYLSNLSESAVGSDRIYSSAKSAQSFWSGNYGGGYSLTSVTLLMTEGLSKSSPLYVSLYISSGSQVGTQIGDFTTGDPYSYAGGGYTWTPNQSITLLSNTKYWIVLETEESSNGYYWDYTDNMNVRSQDGWSIPATSTYAYDGGSGWQYGDGAPYQIAVLASAVPEPSSYVLAVAGWLSVCSCFAVGKPVRRSDLFVVPPMKTPSFVSSAAAIVAILLLLPAARAQMDWSAPADIVDDSDVSTAGTLSYAYVFGGSSVASQTVNGVTFSPFAIPGQEFGPLTVGNVTLSATEFNWNVTSSFEPPFANLSSDYQGLLGENAFSHGSALTLTLAGLTAGQTYEVQLWINNSFNPAINYGATISDGSQVPLRFQVIRAARLAVWDNTSSGW